MEPVLGTLIGITMENLNQFIYIYPLLEQRNIQEVTGKEIRVKASLYT